MGGSALTVLSTYNKKSHVHFTAEVRFIEKLVDRSIVQGHSVMFETLVENPHNRPVTWFRDGQEIKDPKFKVKGGLVLDMVDG